LALTATEISIREVLSKYEAEFAAVAHAAENGEFAIWVGSGISRQAPNLGALIERALNYLRVRAVDAATSDVYRPAFEQALRLARVEPADLIDRFGSPLAAWPERDTIINELWNNYSRVLDIRIKDKPADFILWEAVDIRQAFSHPAPPAAEHLCIAILILEGAVRTVASANWDGFIEAAVMRLSSRSNSASPPSTVSIRRPCAVVVSAHVSLRDLKPAPLSAIVPSRLRRSRVDLANRSSRVTTNTSPFASTAIRRASCLRSDRAPLIFS
jgi:hypothetical protein